MESLIVKRSILINGHKTSVSLEDPFWRGLKEIAQGQHMAISSMIEGIDNNRKHTNLSSAIRLFVLDHIRTQASELPRDRVEANKPNEGSVQNHL